MDYPLTITASAMREINRSAILEIIRRESPISRTAIAERLEVSLPTVMRIVEELTEEGLVRPHGTTEWSGGRRRPLLEFNSSESVVIGIDLGGSSFYGAISDLGGNVLDEFSLPWLGPYPEENYQQLLTLINTLLRSFYLENRKIRGVGVGVPGVTLHSKGIVQWAPALNWRDFPLREKLAAQYNLPMIVDNDMNLAALGELWFGLGQKARNMILMTVTATGIGAGVIIDRALYRGSTDSSGELGSMIPGPQFLSRQYGAFGALETCASVSGIQQQAREILGVDQIQSKEIFTAARRGDEWAVKLITSMVDYLAVAVANLTVFFDPDLIILCGAISQYADLLLNPIVDHINGSIPRLPQISVSQLDRKAVVMGAITNVLHNTSNFYFVHKLS